MSYLDWPDDGYIPSESFLFCGADPCWSPGKEGHTVKPVPGAAKGQTILARSCTLCGGVDSEDTPDDLLYDAETSIFVCAKCTRTHHEGALRGEIGTANMRRYGKMAERIAGKTDTQLNAYLRRVAMAETIDPAKLAVARHKPKVGRDKGNKGNGGKRPMRSDRE